MLSVFVFACFATEEYFNTFFDKIFLKKLLKKEYDYCIIKNMIMHCKIMDSPYRL